MFFQSWDLVIWLKLLMGVYQLMLYMKWRLPFIITVHGNSLLLLLFLFTYIWLIELRGEIHSRFQSIHVAWHMLEWKKKNSALPSYTVYKTALYISVGLWWYHALNPSAYFTNMFQSKCEGAPTFTAAMTMCLGFNSNINNWMYSNLCCLKHACGWISY